jgi:hypothetical protein
MRKENVCEGVGTLIAAFQQHAQTLLRIDDLNHLSKPGFVPQDLIPWFVARIRPSETGGRDERSGTPYPQNPRSVETDHLNSLARTKP